MKRCFPPRAWFVFYRSHGRWVVHRDVCWTRREARYLAQGLHTFKYTETRVLSYQLRKVRP